MGAAKRAFAAHLSTARKRTHNLQTRRIAQCMKHGLKGYVVKTWMRELSHDTKIIQKIFYSIISNC